MRRRTASTACSSIWPTALTPTGGQFPDATTWFQRLDAEATYKFDKEQVAQLGWKGDIKAKLHYAWESNSVANWQNDPLAPFNPRLLPAARLRSSWPTTTRTTTFTC